MAPSSVCRRVCDSNATRRLRREGERRNANAIRGASVSERDSRGFVFPFSIVPMPGIPHFLRSVQSMQSMPILPASAELCGELFGTVADEFGSFEVLVDGHPEFEVSGSGEDAAAVKYGCFDLLPECGECVFSAAHGDDGEGEVVEGFQGCGKNCVVCFGNVADCRDPGCGCRRWCGAGPCGFSVDGGVQEGGQVVGTVVESCGVQDFVEDVCFILSDVCTEGEAVLFHAGEGVRVF